MLPKRRETGLIRDTVEEFLVTYTAHNVKEVVDLMLFLPSFNSGSQEGYLPSNAVTHKKSGTYTFQR